MDELYARKTQEGQLLLTVDTCIPVIGVLVAKLGGSVVITQDDLDGVFRHHLGETYDPKRNELHLKLIAPLRQDS